MKNDDNQIMPFGKYKGVKMADIPDSYLLWLYENDKCYGTIKQYIKDNLEAIKVNIERNKK